MNKVCICFGKNIKNTRIEKGLTQEELSFFLGIDRAQLSKIENGKINIQISTAEKIAKTLNKTISSLLNDIEKTETYPFVKWAGGKTQILDRIIPLLPTKYNNYFEPFIGGGALLFKLKPKSFYINDTNQGLFSAYSCFLSYKTCLELIKKLKTYDINHSEKNYLKVRELDRNEKWVKEASIVERAARMIYLNKTCFNGLYRVNSKGYFNVPSGKKNKAISYDLDNFINILNYFSSSTIHISCCDFSQSVEKAKKGDFVYFDPPYDNLENKKTFTAYAKNGFDKTDQIRLANCFKELDKKGVFVMLSNHNTEFIKELYSNYNLTIIKAKRIINSNPDGRGDVEEVIIRNYK